MKNIVSIDVSIVTNFRKEIESNFYYIRKVTVEDIVQLL
jgi:hypothetical protein